MRDHNHGNRGAALLVLAFLVLTSSILRTPAAAKDDCVGFVDKDGNNICGPKAPPGEQCEAVQGGTCTLKRQACICVCTDPTIHATLITTTPISSFPSTRVFVPLGAGTIEGLSFGTLTGTAEGTITVRFQLDTGGTSPIIVASVAQLALRISGIPGLGVNVVRLLPLNAPDVPFKSFIFRSLQSGGNRLTNTSSRLLINATTGATEGSIGLLFSTTSGAFSLKGSVTGTLDFSTGSWPLTLEVDMCEVDLPICDVNKDEDVDVDDIDAIFAARGTPATPGDPRDADGNERVTVNDARICTLACTKPHCAK